MKKALITGITGQDGSYLVELLLKKGYEVHGMIRRSSSFNTDRIDHLYRDVHVNSAKMFLHYGDLSDASNVARLLEKIKPDEVYNLGAQSHVRVSFDIPEYTADVVAVGALRILDAIKESGIKTRYYQASSSELYGKVQEIPQKETTPFYPRSPYACAKLYAYWITINYRESYGIYACNGILFNHESPRRGETFVTRKITCGLARILAGRNSCLYLGNLDAKRDWGFAEDYVKGMYLMLQQIKPDDYVLATGESHTIREFVEIAFKHVGIDIVWHGHGINEVGINPRTNRTIVNIEERFFRPTEVDYLLGDATKAKRILEWKPKVTFYHLIEMMMESDLKLNCKL